MKTTNHTSILISLAFASLLLTCQTVEINQPHENEQSKETVNHQIDQALRVLARNSSNPIISSEEAKEFAKGFLNLKQNSSVRGLRKSNSGVKNIEFEDEVGLIKVKEINSPNNLFLQKK